MAHLARLIALLVVWLCLSSSAFADGSVPPAANWCGVLQEYTSAGQICAGSPGAEASAMAAKMTQLYTGTCRAGGVTQSYTFTAASTTLSQNGLSATIVLGSSCGGSAGGNFYESAAVSYSCPANSSSSGGSCACASGYVPDSTGTVCQVPPYQCPSTSLGPSTWGPYSSAPKLGSAGFYCQSMGPQGQGCVISYTPDAAFGGVDGWYTTGTEAITGGSCDPSSSPPDGPVPAPGTDPSNGGQNPPTVPPPSGPDPQAPKQDNPCPLGQVPGTVNGSTVCYAPDSSISQQTTTTTTPSGPASAPPGVSPGTTTTTTTCTGGQCTTITTTKDPDGNTTGVTDGTQDQTSYCSDHPNDPICKDPSSFSGSCAASFACHGDAVQCAVAQEQHVRNCQLFDTQTALSQKGNDATAAGDTPGDHPNAPGNISTSTYSLGSLIDQSDAFGGGCPADVVVHGLTLPFSKLCGSLNMIGDVAVAGCLLLAAMIVFKG